MSGDGYTPKEALTLGTPVIVTPCQSFLEMGIENGVNGFVIPFSLKDVDVHKIYESNLKFSYAPPPDKWGKILAKGKSTYNPKMREIAAEATKEFDDIVLKKRIKVGEAVDLDPARYKYLKSKGAVK